MTLGCLPTVSVRFLLDTTLSFHSLRVTVERNYYAHRSTATEMFEMRRTKNSCTLHSTLGRTGRRGDTKIEIQQEAMNFTAVSRGRREKTRA